MSMSATWCKRRMTPVEVTVACNTLTTAHREQNRTGEWLANNELEEMWKGRAFTSGTAQILGIEKISQNGAASISFLNLVRYVNEIGETRGTHPGEKRCMHGFGS